MQYSFIVGCICAFVMETSIDLKYSQFEFGLVDNPENVSEKIEVMKYTEHGSKNRPGAMHQVHLNNKLDVHYAKSVLGEKCFVFIMKKYVEIACQSNSKWLFLL